MDVEASCARIYDMVGKACCNIPTDLGVWTGDPPSGFKEWCE